jgi:hypothetical protein
MNETQKGLFWLENMGGWRFGTAKRGQSRQSVWKPLPYMPKHVIFLQEQNAQDKLRARPCSYPVIASVQLWPSGIIPMETSSRHKIYEPGYIMWFFKALIYYPNHYIMGARGSVVLMALGYKPEGHRYETRKGEILNLPNPSGRTRPWGLLSL